MVHAGGRPTTYSPKRLQQALDYINDCDVKNEIPFVERLAYLMDVSRDTVYEWANVHQEFSDTLKKLENNQRYMLLKTSATKDTFSPGQIFQLKANHGMIETEKRILAGDKDNPLIPQPLLAGQTQHALPGNNSNQEATHS